MDFEKLKTKTALKWKAYILAIQNHKICVLKHGMVHILQGSCHLKELL